MKLLIISKDFPNIIGGISHHTYKLSKELAKRGNQIYILTSKDERIINEVEDKSISNLITIMPYINKWDCINLRIIMKTIKEIKAEAILFQYVPHMYNYYGIPIWVLFFSFSMNFKKYKLITIFHEIAIRINYKNPKYFLSSLLQRIIAYSLCIASKRIIVSIEHYRKMLKFFDEKVHKIPIGSNIEPVIISKEEITKLREKLAPQKEIIISSFGYNPRNNELIIDAIKILNDKGLKIKFLLIGNYPTKWLENIKNKAKQLKILDNIIITGLIKEEEVYKLLSISDIYIVIEPINKFQQGGVSAKSTSLLAGFAAGLPIIANKGDLTESIFHHKENIYLLNSIEPKTIADAVENILSSKDLMQNLRIKAFETYSKFFTWKIVSDKYLEAIIN